MDSESRVYVAGNTGLVGSAIVRMLHRKGYTNILSTPSSHFDLRRQEDVERFFKNNEPEYVYLAAAKVGGIHANDTYPAEFIYENLMIQNNVIHSAYEAGVGRLVFLGSSCIYPKLAKQPMSEGALLTGLLEPTNEPYAIAKIAGIKMCESYRRQYGCDFRAIMPTNLYGPGDNYHPVNSHVIPAMIARFHDCKVSAQPSIELWGSGSPRREFLHVDDMARSALHIMGLSGDQYWSTVPVRISHVNIGSGSEVTIRQLAEIVKDVVDYQGEVFWNADKPDGAPRKLMSSDLARSLGWTPQIDLVTGLRSTYEHFLRSQK